MTKREPPKPFNESARPRHYDPWEAAAWYEQALEDLAEGRHAVKCGCQTAFYQQCGMTKTPNACTAIAKAARDLQSYDVEVEG